MDDRTSRILLTYLSEVKSLSNETSRTSRFAQLVQELFPNSRAPMRLVGGMEKRVVIDMGDRRKRGRIDAYYGNAVIEFETSLRRTGEDAKRQLREYVAGLHQSGAEPNPLCVASDGVEWAIYRARVLQPSPSPQDVDLELLRTISLKKETLREFWIWLTTFLFRDTSEAPTGEKFRLDFGATSPAFFEAMVRSSWLPAFASFQCSRLCCLLPLATPSPDAYTIDSVRSLVI